MARRGVCLARFTNIRPAGRTLFSGTDRADLDGFGRIWTNCVAIRARFTALSLLRAACPLPARRLLISKMGEHEMAKLSLVAFAAMVMTTGAAQANCSNATIQGNWTFTVHGNALTPNGAAVARIDGVGIITFDGFGNLRQQDFIVVNGVHPPPDGFHRNERGQYHIGADCTGKATIDFGDGTSVDLALVVSRAARSIHTVVSSALPADSGLRQVYSDLEKADTQDSQQ